MLGAVPLAATLAIFAGNLDLVGTASTETRAGETPLVADQAPEAAFMQIAIPGAQIVYLGPRLTLLAGYQLRIFWQSSASDPAPAPLYLHRVGLGLSARPTDRSTMRLAAGAFEGAADYTFLPVIYGSNQAALVTVPRVFSTSVTASVQVRATRRLTPALAVEASHSQPVGEMPAAAANGAAGFLLPRFTSAAVTPSLGFQVTRAQKVSLSAMAAYQHVSQTNLFLPTGAPATGPLSVGILVPTLALESRMTPQTDVTLRAGVALTRFAGEVPANPDEVTPNAGFEIHHQAADLQGSALNLLGAASIDYYVDPILAIAAPRGTVTASASVRLAGRWWTGVEGSFASTLSAHPQPTLTVPIYPDEVAASAALRVRHPISPYASVEIGARWADRSPFFSAPNFGFHQRQLWLYVMLGAATRPAQVPTLGL
jgi:hypothetical protein